MCRAALTVWTFHVFTWLPPWLVHIRSTLICRCGRGLSMAPTQACTAAATFLHLGLGPAQDAGVAVAIIVDQRIARAVEREVEGPDRPGDRRRRSGAAGAKRTAPMAIQRIKLVN